jgi:hypothetical protein
MKCERWVPVCEAGGGVVWQPDRNNAVVRKKRHALMFVRDGNK